MSRLEETSDERSMSKVDLDELEKLAKAATAGPWHPRVEGILGSFNLDSGDIELRELPKSSENEKFIAAANPETILKLIAVARAARQGRGGCICDGALFDLGTFFFHSPSCEALTKALSALESE